MASPKLDYKRLEKHCGSDLKHMQGERNQADDQSPQTLHFLFQEAIDSKTNIIHMADKTGKGQKKSWLKKIISKWYLEHALRVHQNLTQQNTFGMWWKHRFTS